ncbi:hypothetical protein, partial [Notoacmeibacter marinus]|uniref:hypothetical protein n=1 Tax=Notoacmeibacter marinus TaxID=1876515 RepID=UPI0019646064
NTAHAADGKAGLLRLDESEAHRLGSFAKKAAAFFRMSRSCFSIAFSRRNRFNSACMSTEASTGSLASRSRLSHRVNVESPIPRSSAISLFGPPLVRPSPIQRPKDESS